MSQDEAISALRSFLKLFNIFIILIFIVGIIDYLTHASIQVYMANKLFAGTEFGNLILLEHNYMGVYRYYSLFGHPLTNSFYFLLFFVMNSIYTKQTSKSLINGYIVSLITLVGLILSGSKTGLVLGLVFILFFGGVKKNKVFYFMILSGLVLWFLNTSLFTDNLQKRFLQGMQSGDITTGRNSLLQTLFYRGAELPNFFVGGGAGYSRIVSQNLDGGITNFEYPSIMLAYDYGIIWTLIIYFILFIFPMYKLLRQKRFYAFLLFSALSVMINTNNGIANLSSDMLSVFSFITLLIINLGKEPIAEKVKRKRIKLRW